jgi:hypothetical protein
MRKPLKVKNVRSDCRRNVAAHDQKARCHHIVSHGCSRTFPCFSVLSYAHFIDVSVAELLTGCLPVRYPLGRRVELSH